MKILHQYKQEDCFDGSTVYIFDMSQAWTVETVMRLADLGELEYYADFPRPFFRLRTIEGLFVSGVAGSTTCRVILPRTGRDAARQKLETLFAETEGNHE